MKTDRTGADGAPAGAEGAGRVALRLAELRRGPTLSTYD